MTRVRAFLDHARNLSAFSEACAWAERIELCLTHARGVDGDHPGWRHLEPHLAKVSLAIVSVASTLVEPTIVRHFYDLRVLRLAPGDHGTVDANVFLFHRGEHCRVLFVPTGLDAQPSVRVRVGLELSTGEHDASVHALRQLFEELRAHAHLPLPRDLERYEERVRQEREHASRPPPPVVAAGLDNVNVSGHVVLEGRPDRIAAALDTLRDALGRGATVVPVTLRTKHEVLDLPVGWLAEAAIWSAWQERDEHLRLWVGRGLPENGDAEPWLALNVATQGVDRRFGAAIARDESTGATYLLHRGVFRTFRLGEKLFWSNTRARTIEIVESKGEPATRFAVIGAIDDPQLARHVAGFADEVRRLQVLLEPTAQSASAGVGVAEQDADEEEEPSTPFDDLDEDDQLELVWTILLGEGALDLDTAIRTAARGLRDQGAVSFERLRSDGPLYDHIKSILRRGVAEECFDRPKKKHIRAIIADPDGYDIELWRDCLLDALTEEPTARQDAIKAAADIAADRYGLAVRFYAGGRIEDGLKSAINSAIRRGLVEKGPSNTIALPTPDVTETIPPPSRLPSEPALHLLVGSNDDGDIFDQAIDDDDEVIWTVPKKASPGDEVLIAFPSFTGPLRGAATIQDTPTEDEPGSGSYSATLHELRHIAPIDLATLQDEFPDWGWPRYSRSYTTPTAEIADALRVMVEDASTLADEFGVVPRVERRPFIVRPSSIERAESDPVFLSMSYEIARNGHETVWQELAVGDRIIALASADGEPVVHPPAIVLGIEEEGDVLMVLAAHRPEWSVVPLASLSSLLAVTPLGAQDADAIVGLDGPETRLLEALLLAREGAVLDTAFFNEMDEV